MIVSTGMEQLGQKADPLTHTDNVPDSYAGIHRLYLPYMNGEEEELKQLPGNVRSYQLYLWTMTIQNSYDTSAHTRNAESGLTYLHNSGNPYLSKAIESGLPEGIVNGSEYLIEGMIRLLRIRNKFRRIRKRLTT